MPHMNQDRTRPGQEDAEKRINALEHWGGAFVAAVRATRMPMVVTDPGVAGNPIIYANPAFLALCGYDMGEILGQNYLFLVNEDAEPGLALRARAALAAHDDLQEEIAFRRKDGRRIWVAAFISPVLIEGRIVQHFASFLDITRRVELEHQLKDAKATLERRVTQRTRTLQATNARLEAEIERRSRLEQVLRDSLLQREEDLRYRGILAREIDHRTKNALQTAAAMLLVQATQSNDPAVAEALRTATGRLHRMAEVHALLYQGRQPDSVDVSVYLRRLVEELGEALQPARGLVHLGFDADELFVHADMAVALGLFVGEAVTNALKHAFPEERAGRIGVALRAADDGQVLVEVEDDGVGLPISRREGGIGLQLMEAFADRLNGQVSVRSGQSGGTRVSLCFTRPGTDQDAEMPAS